LPVLLDKNNLDFPPLRYADEDGLLAVGGDLSVPRLLNAYRNGIFPWYGEKLPILWYCPDPRFVLFPQKLHVSRSMEKVFRRGTFEIKFNTAFDEVIAHCAQVERPGQDGTWIIPEMVDAYKALHRLGHAHSAEAWREGKLVGGVYGVRLGRIFFGESMFSLEPNASKAAFITYVRQLEREGGALVDCQMKTPHLESLGGEFISLRNFLKIVQANAQ